MGHQPGHTVLKRVQSPGAVALVDQVRPSTSALAGLRWGVNAQGAPSATRAGRKSGAAHRGGCRESLTAVAPDWLSACFRSVIRSKTAPRFQLPHRRRTEVLNPHGHQRRLVPRQVFSARLGADVNLVRSNRLGSRGRFYELHAHTGSSADRLSTKARRLDPVPPSMSTIHR